MSTDDTYFRFLQVTQESTARGFRCSGSVRGRAVSEGVLLGGVSIMGMALSSSDGFERDSDTVSTSSSHNEGIVALKAPGLTSLSAIIILELVWSL